MVGLHIEKFLFADFNILAGFIDRVLSVFIDYPELFKETTGFLFIISTLHYNSVSLIQFIIINLTQFLPKKN